MTFEQWIKEESKKIDGRIQVREERLAKQDELLEKFKQIEADAVQNDAAKAEIPSKEDTLDIAECCSEDSEADAAPSDCESKDEALEPKGSDDTGADAAQQDVDIPNMTLEQWIKEYSKEIDGRIQAREERLAKQDERLEQFKQIKGDTVQDDAVKAQIPPKEDTLDTAECCSEDNAADAGDVDVDTSDKEEKALEKSQKEWREAFFAMVDADSAEQRRRRAAWFQQILAKTKEITHGNDNAWRSWLFDKPMDNDDSETDTAQKDVTACAGTMPPKHKFHPRKTHSTQQKVAVKTLRLMPPLRCRMCSSPTLQPCWCTTATRTTMIFVHFMMQIGTNTPSRLVTL